ncbi:hypothetical protein MXB_4953, partial [Myxobolus squamalis]
MYKFVRILMSMPKFIVALKPSDRIFNLDLMNLPIAYDIEEETVLLYPPIAKSEFKGNFTTRTKPFFTLNHLNDFDGLEKYTTPRHPSKSLPCPVSFQTLLDMRFPGDPSKHSPESLSAHLLESYKSRIECRIYGTKFKHNIPQLKFMSNEIKEHAKIELLNFYKSCSDLKKSKLSQRSPPPKKRKKMKFK